MVAASCQPEAGPPSFHQAMYNQEGSSVRIAKGCCTNGSQLKHSKRLLRAAAMTVRLATAR